MTVGEIATILLIVAITIATIIGGVNCANSNECDEIEHRTGRDTEYEFWGGCFIQTSQGMVPLKSFKVEE